MIKGIGIDVCSIARFEAMCERRPGIVNRLLTEAEAALPLQSQAGRFAAKEALAKALGAPSGLVWLDAEIVPHPSGDPTFELRGTVLQRAEELGVTAVHVSISHDDGIAVAYVICEAP